MSTTAPRALPTFTRALAVVLLVLGLAPLGAGPAAAHASLVASDPRDGATLDRLPSRVSLTFSEDIVTPAYVVVRAADGADVTAGGPVVDGATVTQDLAGSAATGEVTLAYRVVSVDGHPVTGELTVTVAEPPGRSAGRGQADQRADQPADQEAADGAAGSADGSTDAAADDLAATSAESAESAGVQGFVGRHASHFLLGAFLVLAAGLLLWLSRKRPAT